MKNKLLLLCGIVSINFAWAAAPTLAVTDLVYQEGVENYGVTNADVKHELIKSGKFKLMNTPKDFNPNTVLAEIKDSQPLVESSESGIKLAKPVLGKDKYKPEYILVGEVVSSDVSNNSYQVKNTNTSTGTKTLSLSVEYSLIDVADNAITSSFIINASGSQTAILDSSTSQVSVNRSKLVKEVSQDLATQVSNELSSVGKVSANSDTAIVKNFSTID